MHDTDFNLLVRRFIKDSYTLDYVEFIRAVEAVKKEGIRGLGVEYQNPAAVIDTTLPKLSRPEVEAGLSTAPLGASEDYDPLNSGRIAPQQFRRAMDAMGLGVVLSPEEVHPELQPGPSAAASLPPRGSAAERGGPGEGELDLAQAALLRVRAATKERSIDLRPAFGDHDEHNNGHVSRGQLRRVLARLGLLPTAEQVRALEARYLDDCGFSYTRLLDELEERPHESATIAPPKPATRTKRKEQDPLETDIVQILAKIKGKVSAFSLKLLTDQELLCRDQYYETFHLTTQLYL
ncbi:hypothetical protein MSG28_008347 [Choristoneura fumiferana]|uniref:Uncharacterized protein n=1 Tax=Choristoneura fumiferana TaxID=7141 RepID=A0ACC0JB63_CHOFU|nr:hypothetical protein MSG28_008347 [Choristoneura fumiferana]